MAWSTIHVWWFCISRISLKVGYIFGGGWLFAFCYHGLASVMPGFFSLYFSQIVTTAMSSNFDQSIYLCVNAGLLSTFRSSLRGNFAANIIDHCGRGDQMALTQLRCPPPLNADLFQVQIIDLIHFWCHEPRWQYLTNGRHHFLAGLIMPFMDLVGCLNAGKEMWFDTGSIFRLQSNQVWFLANCEFWYLA